MDYEKAYREALAKAREIHRNEDGKRFDMEWLFPELKESKDEKIRKTLLSSFEYRIRESYPDKEWICGVKLKEIVAWLEKQGKRDARYENLEELLEADTMYQMAMNDAMVEGAKTKAMNALSELEIGKLLGIEKQGEQKHVNDTVETIVEAVSNTSILDMIEDKDAFTNPGAFENSLGRLLKLFEKLPKQDLLDGLKFYANVVEHDGEYVKPTEWSEEDEEIWKYLNHVLCDCGFKYNDNGERDKAFNWLKSLKERLCTQWKPNEVQMKALHDLNLTGNISYAGQGQALIELYEQLKKDYHDR